MRAPLIAVVACFASEGSHTFAAPTCVGEGSAVVYLHGMGATVPSSAELEVVGAFARASHLRVAIPRASRNCPSDAGASCWGWAFDDAEREATAQAIDAAASVCFSADERYGLLGFSNGGYAALEIVAHGEGARRLPRARWVVAVGASSDVPDPFLQSTALEGEPPVVMVAGERDTSNFDPSDRYAKRLERAGVRVESLHYDGAHDLANAPLAEALARAQRMQRAE